MQHDALHIDFETRSTVDLRKTGAFVYAEHGTTDLWCACWAIGDAPVRVWRPGEPQPAELAAYVAAGSPVLAHNAQFERAIWTRILTPRYGWPAPKIEQWHCTAAMAAAMSLPRSLEDAAKVMCLSAQKDKEGHGLMLRMARPRKTEDGGRLIWWDAPERIERLIAYCKQDVETERALHAKLRPLPKHEQRIFWLDMLINERGLQIDLELIGAAERLVEKVKRELDTEMALVTGGNVQNCDRVGALALWVREQGYDVDSLDKESLRAIAESEAPEQVKKACALRQMAAKKSTAKLQAFRRYACADGRIRGHLLYHGASTGRWAGAGPQIQNLPRPVTKNVEEVIDDILSGASAKLLDVLYGPPMAVVADCLRGVIVAPPGKRLIAADFNAIEARVLAWLAWQDDVVSAFANGRDVYRQMAGQIYGKPAEQIEKGGVERFVGKTAVLGCGYGCGGPKFSLMCQSFGVEIDEDEGRRIVDIYRSTNSAIKALWYETEAAAVEAVAAPGKIASCGLGRVRFKVKGGFLWLVLPSGRALAYPSPKLQEKATPWGEIRQAVTFLGVNTYTRQWGRQDTYGGKLVENAVQAIARDLMAESMLRLEAAGYPVVASIHDEIMAEVEEGFGSVDEFEHIMAKTPAWANDCPVAVEGWSAKRFRK